MNKLYLIFFLTLLAGCSDNDNEEEIPNASPIIANIDDQQISANQASDPIEIFASDDTTPASNLMVSLNSSDQSLIRDEDLVLTSFSNTRAELTITPISGSVGNVEITLNVTDADNATSNASFMVTVNNQQLGANSLIRTIFANDKNSEPASLEAIDLTQDIDDESQYDDLIGSGR